MPQLGPMEIVVIFVVALLVFGPQRLPEIGRQVARGIRELRSFQQNLRDEFDDALSPPAYDADLDPGPPTPKASDELPGATAPEPSPPAIPGDDASADTT